MAGNDTESLQLDPFVKPKPGKKVPPAGHAGLFSSSFLETFMCSVQPKAALYGPRTIAKAASANTPAKSRSAYGAPPVEQQKLTLCKYFEQGEH